MNDLYIIEGADCTGKSTLARYMSKHLLAGYIHATGKKSLHTGMSDYHLSILDSVQVMLDNGIPVVLDRHWPSEWCYGRTLRLSVSAGYRYDEVWKRLSDMNPHYIFCFSDGAHDRQISSPDNDHPYCSTDYAMVYGEYRALCTDMELGKLFKLDRPRITKFNMEINGNHNMETFINSL